MARRRYYKGAYRASKASRPATASNPSGYLWRSPVSYPSRNLAVRRRGSRRIPNGIPTQQYVKLPYREALVLSGTAAGSISYKLNSIFDPQGTLANFVSAGLQSNAQPLYRDQYASLYDVYRVLGTKITLTMKCGTDTSATVLGQRVAAYVDDAEITSPQNPVINSERKGARYAIVDTSRIKRLSWFTTLWRGLGIPRMRYKDAPEFGANVTTNPATPVFLNIDTDTMNTTGTTNSILYIDVRIVFYVLFSDPTLVSGS